MPKQRILLVSALFPPDIAVPAPYLKELAARLSKEYEVTILTYGSHPETVAATDIETVSKDQPAWWRILAFTLKLRRLAHATDYILLNNGPATELPAYLMGKKHRHKLYFLITDHKVEYTGWRKRIHRAISSQARKVLTITPPLSRPEIHPYRTTDAAAHSEYELSWKKHLAFLAAKLI
ncbi:hypothetical protein N9L26_01710 [Candidatus Pacebacteria bacterium]|nr:hypothetical protein [Candidatus Paceibacterota bacterium]